MNHIFIAFGIILLCVSRAFYMGAISQKKKRLKENASIVAVLLDLFSLYFIVGGICL